MIDIYIACAITDRPTARLFAQLLDAQGYAVAPRRLLNADAWREEDITPDDARCVMVLWSQASIASPPVREEAAAGAKNGRLIELMLGPHRAHVESAEALPIDFSDWDGSAHGRQWRALSQRLRHFAGAKTGLSFDVHTATQGAVMAALILICSAVIMMALRTQIQQAAMPEGDTQRIGSSADDTSSYGSQTEANAAQGDLIDADQKAQGGPEAVLDQDRGSDQDSGYIVRIKNAPSPREVSTQNAPLDDTSARQPALEPQP
jgi:hypothetical protein